MFVQWVKYTPASITLGSDDDILSENICKLRKGTFGTDIAIKFDIDGKKIEMLRIINKNGSRFNKTLNEIRIIHQLNKEKYTQYQPRMFRNKFYTSSDIYNKAEGEGSGDYAFFSFSGKPIFETRNLIGINCKYFKFSLKYLLKQYTFSDYETAEIIRGCCLPIQYIHELGIAHCNVCPEVFVMDEAFNIVLHDVGSAQIVGNRRSDKKAINRMIKTLSHKRISPNILARKKIDNQYYLKLNDIYAIGIMLFEFIIKNSHQEMTPDFEKFRKFIAKSNVYKISLLDERFDSTSKNYHNANTSRIVDWEYENRKTISLLDNVLNYGGVGYVCGAYVNLLKQTIHHIPTKRIRLDQVGDVLQECIVTLSFMSNPRKYTLKQARFANGPAKKVWFQRDQRKQIEQTGKALRQLIYHYRKMSPESIDSVDTTNTFIGLCKEYDDEIKTKMVKQAIHMCARTDEEEKEMGNAVGFCGEGACLLSKLFVIRYFYHESVTNVFNCEYWKRFLLSRLSDENMFFNFGERDVNIAFDLIIEEQYCDNIVYLRDEHVSDFAIEYRV